jgi:hypothetical protein
VSTADHEECPLDLLATRVLKRDGRDLMFDELPSEAKAEALIPLLLSSCARLPSSPYRHAFQDIFGRLVFYARSALCGFHVTRKGSASDLTVEAKSYLHGRSLSSLMGAPEEAFVRFVIITDFVRHHYNSVCNLVEKYKHLISDNVGYSNLNGILEDWVGTKGVPEKGFRTTDISFYQSIKAIVMEERRTNTFGSPCVKTEDGTLLHGASAKKLIGNHFVFDYPMSVKQGLKLESSSLVGKKCKLLEGGGDFIVGGPQSVESLAMSLDDDDDFFSDSIGIPAMVPC